MPVAGDAPEETRRLPAVREPVREPHGLDELLVANEIRETTRIAIENLFEDVGRGQKIDLESIKDIEWTDPSMVQTILIPWGIRIGLKKLDVAGVYAAAFNICDQRIPLPFRGLIVVEGV